MCAVEDTDLSDGRMAKVVFELPNTIRIQCGDEEVAIERPSCGIGQHALVTGPGERHLVFWYSSGQGDFGYSVFGIDSRLELVRTFGPRSGMAEPPVFSQDGESLFTVWAENVSLSAEDQEPTEGMKNTHAFDVVFGGVRQEHLTSGEPSECEVVVSLPVGYPTVDGPEYWPELIEHQGDIALAPGWGKPVLLPNPLPERLCLNARKPRGG